MKFAYLGHGGGLCNGEAERVPILPRTVMPPAQPNSSCKASTLKQRISEQVREKQWSVSPQLALSSVFPFTFLGSRARLSQKAVALSVLEVVLVAKILSHWPVGELLGVREGGSTKPDCHFG